MNRGDELFWLWLAGSLQVSMLGLSLAVHSSVPVNRRRKQIANHWLTFSWVDSVSRAALWGSVGTGRRA